MALFHFIGLDRKGALPTRLAVRPAHLEYAKTVSLLGGALLDAEGNPMGSVLIIEADSLEEAKIKVDGDPYAKADLFESTELRPWRVGIGKLGEYGG